MNVKNCRRILIVGAPNSGALDVVRDLTGSAPQPDESGSTAGLSHEWSAKTAYYTAEIPIWIDEISDLDAWKTEFSKPEAKEVVEAVGAWVYCFKATEDGSVSAEAESTMKAIQSIAEEQAGYGADTLMLAAAMPPRKESIMSDTHKDEWEDTAIQYGFEHIAYNATGNNEFGEKVGFERLKEALETNDWAATSSTSADAADAFGLDSEDGLEDFSYEEAEMTAELFGVKSALVGDDWEPDAGLFGSKKDEESQVEDLDRMMAKLMAVKEQSADLPEAQRRKLAAKAVRELMSEGR